MSVKRYGINSQGSFTNNSDGAYVSFNDYAALEKKLTDMAVQLANAESKCRELAAENDGLNVFIEEECFVYSSDTPEPIDANDCKPETPVTDAFLAEVRSQGVEMAIVHIEQTICPNHETILNEFAAQLRKGAAL
ncbi:TPA: hypothetical protein ACQ98W_002917 [Citrobacter braakii]